MFRKQIFTDWLTTPTVELVKLETPNEHLDRFNARAKQLRDQMKQKWLLHESNRVRRLDGRTFTKSQEGPKGRKLRVA